MANLAISPDLRAGGRFAILKDFWFRAEIPVGNMDGMLKAEDEDEDEKRGWQVLSYQEAWL